MAVGISKRVFGSDLSPRVKQKLLTRQLLANSANPNESVDLNTKLIGDDGVPISIDRKEVEAYRSSFDGKYDLSSRTPFARLWTAVEIRKQVKVDEDEIDKDGKTKFDNESALRKRNHVYVRDDNVMIKKRVYKGDQIVYEVGNHKLQQFSVSPNERVQGSQLSAAEPVLKEIIPNFFETNDNQYFRPHAVIKGVSSETQGSLGAIKKTKIDFKVFNFADYDNIFSQYFMRPGAQVFIDFGWDTSDLYNPRDIVDKSSGIWGPLSNPSTRGQNLEDIFYGPKGYVTTSNGDLETIVGFVTKWDSKIQSDGSFECMVEISSKNTALMDKSIEGDDELKHKIIDNLDYDVINFAEEYFRGDYLKKDGDLTHEEEQNWRKASHRFAAANLTGHQRNVPSIKNSKIGIYWKSLPPLEERQAALEEVEGEDTDTEINLLQVSDGKNLYVTWGFFEDKILCGELGVGANLKDVLYGKDLSARYDSSNSFIRWDIYLWRRQTELKEKEGEALAYLYPEYWHHDTYSSDRDKVPEDRKDGKQPDPVRLLGVNRYIHWTKEDKRLKRIPLREVFINLSIIKDAVKNNSDISAVVKYVLDKIKSESYDIIDLKPISNNYAQTELSLIDINYVNAQAVGTTNQINTTDEITGMDLPYLSGLFTFRPHSPNSMITNYDLQYTTPGGGLANMIAIQGMGPGNSLFPMNANIDMNLSFKHLEESGVVTHDGEAEFGTTFIPEVGDHGAKQIARNQNQAAKIGKADFASTDPVIGADATTAEKLNVLSNFTIANPSQLSGDLSKTGGYSELERAYEKNYKEEAAEAEGTDDTDEEPEEKYGSAHIAPTISEYWGLLAKKQFFAEKTPSVMPLKLSLTMYGMSQLAPGDVFRVDYLPKRYLDKVFFQVTKVKHDIKAEGWKTTLETVMRISPDSKKKNQFYRIPTDFYLSKKALEKELKLHELHNISHFVGKITVLPGIEWNPADKFSWIDYCLEFTAQQDHTFRANTTTGYDQFANGWNIKGGEKEAKKIGSIWGKHVDCRLMPPIEILEIPSYEVNIPFTDITLFETPEIDLEIGGWDWNFEGKLQKGKKYRLFVGNSLWFIADSSTRWNPSNTAKIDKLFRGYYSSTFNFSSELGLGDGDFL